MPRDADILGVDSYSDLTDPSEPVADDAHCGRHGLVEVLRVSVDCTEKKITDAKCGDAPEGYYYLLDSHDSLGRVLEVAENVRSLRPGDYVVTIVRRAGTSIRGLST